MSQENSSDLSTKFSTLNVNAMEFVPSFASATPAPAAAPVAASDAVPSPATESPIPTPIPVETPTEDLSPTKSDSEAKPVTATPLENVQDKSPENPGIELTCETYSFESKAMICFYIYIVYIWL